MIDCACIDTSDGEPAEFYQSREVWARKSHKCNECGEEIKPGHKYHYAKAKWDGTFETFKTCNDCMEISKAFFCQGGVYHGGVWAEIDEYLYPGECLSKLMLKITETARAKILKWMEDHDRLEEE